MKKRGYFTAFFLFIFLFLMVVVSNVSAFSVFNALKGVGDAILGKDDKNIKDKRFTIESGIALAAGGDINQNGEADAGDIVKFTYTITNTTDQEYSFATLKTNINRAQLNFIHNITGTASLNDDGKAIEVPNFRIGINQVATIAFDARVNYYTSEDPDISTEAEFFTEDQKSVAKSAKSALKAKRISKDKIPGMVTQQVMKEGNE